MNDLKEKLPPLFKAHPEVVAVYLFGSHARGRAKASSDVDLAFLLDTLTDIDEFALKRAMTLGICKVLRKDIHLVILNRAGERLAAQVFKHGECVYNADPGTLSAFKMVQFSKIADFAYLKNIMEKGFTRKLLGAGVDR